MRGIGLVLVVVCIPFLMALSPSSTNPPAQAPAAFDGKSNGMVDDATHQADLTTFDEVEDIKAGLGPIYNAQSCRECHQNPVSGAASQVSELRVGHLDAKGRFQNPDIPVARGKEIIKDRTLVNDRAICPNGAFADTEIQERVPEKEKVRTFRISVNLLGDGFVEAVPDDAFDELAKEQCRKNHHKICGTVVRVPILEAPGQAGVGRFGWKDQQASLLSFAGDAYLNEMGITNRLIPEEVTNLCNTATEPNDKPDSAGLADIDRFARFVRATKAPPPDQTLADTPEAKHGSELFDKIGCSECHVRSMTTAPAGTKINGGTFTVPDALGNKEFHPYSDFLMHSVGTGDGIAVAIIEHYGRSVMRFSAKREFTPENFQSTRNHLRTPPLWGVRMRPRLMHDGESTTLADAIKRHAGEANEVKRRFKRLPAADREAVLAFLRSL